MDPTGRPSSPFFLFGTFVRSCTCRVGTCRVVSCAFRRKETSWWHHSSCIEFCGSYLPRTEELKSGLEAREYCVLDSGYSVYDGPRDAFHSPSFPIDPKQWAVMIESAILSYAGPTCVSDSILHIPGAIQTGALLLGINLLLHLIDLSLFSCFRENKKTVPSFQATVSSIYKYPKSLVCSSISPLYDHRMVMLGQCRPHVHPFRYLWSYCKQKRLSYKPQSN
jgi:hypothetical protein